jgi:O-antigen/teichoic acid export membrane protein
MYGHSRVLLLNAVATGLLNLILNALFIPTWGLFGAALATAISNVCISVLQIIELKRLEALGVRASYYLRTLAASAPSIGAVAFFTLFSWSATSTPFDAPNWVMRTALAVATGSAYLMLSWFLPGPRPWSLPSRRS